MMKETQDILNTLNVQGKIPEKRLLYGLLHKVSIAWRYK